jgi:hypothetical protein
MEVIGLITVGVLVFLLGWMTGNIVEWVTDAHHRRISERRAAEHNLQMWAEQQRADRE